MKNLDVQEFLRENKNLKFSNFLRLLSHVIPEARTPNVMSRMFALMRGYRTVLSPLYHLSSFNGILCELLCGTNLKVMAQPLVVLRPVYGH